MGAREAKPKRHWRFFVCALVVGPPLLALAALTLAGPASAETSVFAMAVVAMVVGGLVAPWRSRLVWLARAGLTAMALVVVWRLVAAESGVTVRSLRGPDGHSGRWLDRLVPERDVALGGTALLMALDMMDPPEPGLRDALRSGYDRMRHAEGAVPSAIVGTFLVGQEPDDHTLLHVGPPRSGPPEAVVVFLHGYIGNITVACWQVAQAANPVGLDVVCPSTGWRARWAEPPGRATVEATLARLRDQGVQRIYLAGLSAGAMGVSQLAADLDVEGVILISGASLQARRARVPTLVLQGRRDPRTPPAPARAYARSLGAQARYVEHPDAGHWLILSHHDFARDHLRRWLAEQEGRDGRSMRSAW